MHHSVVHVCVHQLNVRFCLTVHSLHACGQQLLVNFLSSWHLYILAPSGAPVAHADQGHVQSQLGRV